jgi:predicted transcriptional regulator of viral defense system
MNTKTLSTQSAKLLECAHAADGPAFRLEDAYGWLPGSRPDAVRQLLAGMVRRGLLMRVKEGLFYIVPFEQSADDFMPNWHLLGHYLAGEIPYYIGYGSALQLRGLNVQPVLEEHIVMARQVKPSIWKLKGVPFRFIYHNPKHFFGFDRAWVDDHHRVQCSDLEKTLVDCLFRPQYAGGITEVVRAIHKSRQEIDQDRLFEYVQRFGSQAVAKRLGFLLEMLEVDGPILQKLYEACTSSAARLDPSAKSSDDKSANRWGIVQNVNTATLINAITT